MKQAVRRWKFLLAAAVMAGLVFVGNGRSAAGEKEAPAQVNKGQPAAMDATPNYVRIKRDKGGDPLAMQTAVVRFVPAKGNNDLVVDLVSVVHIGDRGYYNELNRRFLDYDAVLYELVAPKGTRVPRGGSNPNNPLSFIQKAMTVVLGLESQLEIVDYQGDNFIHADMSPAEMAEAMEKRGDNMLTLTLSIAADVLRQENLRQQQMKNNPNALKKLEEFDPLSLLTDPEASSRLKGIMAEQMADMGNGDGLGKTLNTLLVQDRNAACMRVFQKELANGKKKIAIFYGAAHMPDFEQRLTRDFGMRREREDWLTAWDLRPRQMNLLDLLDKLSR